MVLKRGMLTDSAVIDWFLRAFRDREFQPAGVTVILMNEKSAPLRSWKIAHAIPRKWALSDLNASENAIVVETLELSYRYFTTQ
jgi:phage tail-like protein